MSVSTLQLTFDFEDKLKKFIEENCPYNFEISITKSQSGVEIQNGNSPDVVQELIHINNMLDDLYYDEELEYIEGKSDIEDAIEDLIEKIDV